MKYSALIYPFAQNDLLETKEYFENKLKIGFDDFIDSFISAVSKTEENPFIFPLVNDIHMREKGYRKFNIGNYLVFYIVVQHTIQIRRILFGRRHYSDFL